MGASPNELSTMYGNERLQLFELCPAECSGFYQWRILFEGDMQGRKEQKCR